MCFIITIKSLQNYGWTGSLPNGALAVLSADLNLVASALRFLELRIDDEEGAARAAAAPQHPVLKASSNHTP